MYEALRKGRPTLMGIAILMVVVFHAPLALQNPYFNLVHAYLYCGVDIFLLLSGIGACWSVPKHGGRQYLFLRARRMLPGLLPFLLIWSLVMFFAGLFSIPELIGSITLTGWWLGQEGQLNWYFSGVWFFFLLAIPMTGCMKRSKRPLVFFLSLLVCSLLLYMVNQYSSLQRLISRIPVFLLGILIGTMEQRGLSSRRFELVSILLMIPGIILLHYVYNHLYSAGYTYGLWWYPLLLVIPGFSILAARTANLMRRSLVGRILLRPIDWCGDASSELLAIHMGLYKIIQYVLGLTFSNRCWLLIALVSCIISVLYKKFIVPPLTGIFDRLIKCIA